MLDFVDMLFIMAIGILLSGKAPEKLIPAWVFIAWACVIGRIGETVYESFF